jgi:hypothetical protein
MPTHPTRQLSLGLVLLLVVGVPASPLGAQAAQLPKGVIHKVDRFNGLESWKSDLGDVGKDADLEATVWKFRVAGEEDDYRLTFVFRAKDWAFLDNAPSLWLINHDGHPVSIGGTGDLSDARRIVSGGVVEMAGAKFTAGMLKYLAQQESVEFRLNGTRRDVEGELTKKAKERILTFLAAVR